MATSMVHKLESSLIAPAAVSQKGMPSSNTVCPALLSTVTCCDTILKCTGTHSPHKTKCYGGSAPPSPPFLKHTHSENLKHDFQSQKWFDFKKSHFTPSFGRTEWAGAVSVAKSKSRVNTWKYLAQTESSKFQLLSCHQVPSPHWLTGLGLHSLVGKKWGAGPVELRLPEVGAELGRKEGTNELPQRSLGALEVGVVWQHIWRGVNLYP